MQSGKAHVLYKVNKKKVGNGKKMIESIKDFEKLLKRFEKRGTTKWLRNAYAIAAIRMKKYNVTVEKIEKKVGFDRVKMLATK